MARLRITWKRSAIGYPAEQRATLRALGFRSLNQTIVKDDSPVVRGMVNRVRHLVESEEVREE